MFCKNCGMQMKDDELFCKNCGTKNEKNIEQSKSEMKKEKNNRKLKGKKKVAVVAILLAIVIGLTTVLVPVIKNTITPNTQGFFCYIKDGDIYINNFEDNTSRKLTKKLVVSQVEDEDYSALFYECQYHTRYFESSDRIFFPDRIDTDSDGLNLYYTNLKGVKEGESLEPIKIDSNIASNYVITDDGNKVYYTSTNDSCLYMSDLQSKTLIASNVDEFYVNSDSSIVVYSTRIDKVFTLFVINSGGETKQVADNVNIHKVSTDCGIVCYEKDNTLYSLVDGNTVKEVYKKNDKTYINVNFIDSTDKIYFTVNKSNDLPISDLIIDDLAETDFQMSEPSRDDKKYWKTYTRILKGDEVQNEYGTSFTDAYYADKASYEKKLKRDELRNALSEKEIHLTNRTLYCFDGDEYKQLIDGVGSDFVINKDAIIFNQKIADSEKKIEFSKICNSIEEYDVYEAIDCVYDTLTYNYTYYSIINNTVNQITSGTKIQSFLFNSDNTAIYYIDMLEQLYGDLYKVDINGNKLSKSKKIYEMVSAYSVTENDDVVYYKDPILVDEENEITSCDLYINDKKIDSNVIGTGSFSNYIGVKYTKDGTMFYGTDYVLDNPYRFTLKQYDTKDVKTIASDVTFYVPVAADTVYYVNNYNNSLKTGNIKLLKDEKTLQIASNVTTLYIPLTKYSEE